MKFGLPFLGFSNKFNTFYKKPIVKAPIPHINNKSTISNNEKSQKKEDEPFFLDIFGIRLFYDDILLISLIFFLYSEGVDDSSLFIVLVLLLLS